MQGSVAELAPEVNPGAKAQLDYNHQLVDVSVVHSFVGGVETLQFMGAGGEVLDQEAYVRTPKAFLLKQADGDFFEPPLPLLSDEPVATWSGNLVSGDVKHPASATVKTSPGTVKSQPLDLKGTLVTVGLELDSGGKIKAKRELKFWIVKGRGVVQSEFGMGVKRLPVD